MLRMEVVGDKELARRLRVTQRGLANLSPTNRRIARLVTTTARANAPKRTGRLASTASATANRREATISFGAVYAGPVHWGWPDRPQAARGWRGGPIAPNPFAARAAKELEPTWTRLYGTAVERMLDGETQL